MILLFLIYWHVFLSNVRTLSQPLPRDDVCRLMTSAGHALWRILRERHRPDSHQMAVFTWKHALSLLSCTFKICHQNWTDNWNELMMKPQTMFLPQTSWILYSARKLYTFNMTTLLSFSYLIVVGILDKCIHHIWVNIFISYSNSSIFLTVHIKVFNTICLKLKVQT